MVIVTDNDGNVENVENKYKPYNKVIELCVEEDETLKTLEPSILHANEDSFEKFKSIIYNGNDVNKRSKEEIEEFMKNNKTEWGMRVFDAKEKIGYPNYITKAIDFYHEK